jgi:hypothetical protein
VKGPNNIPLVYVIWKARAPDAPPFATVEEERMYQTSRTKIITRIEPFRNWGIEHNASAQHGEKKDYICINIPLEPEQEVPGVLFWFSGRNRALLVYQTQISGFDSMIFRQFNFSGWLTGVRPDRGNSGSSVMTQIEGGNETNEAVVGLSGEFHSRSAGTLIVMSHDLLVIPWSIGS